MTLNLENMQVMHKQESQKKSTWALKKRNGTMDCPFASLGWASEPPSVCVTAEMMKSAT